MSEQRLPGGFRNEVIRSGDTVLRSAPKAAGFVRRLLRHFEQQRWPGAPRFLGVDGRGREVLTYIEGYVPWAADTASPQVRSEESIALVARLVRQFHDLTAGSELAGDQEVVCHNDLSPRNTVYRNLGAGLRPVAFIDWDIAAPGERIHDVAHACWQYLDLGPETADAAGAARRIRLMTTHTGWPTGPDWWTRFCGGRSDAGVGSKPPRPPGNPRWCACAILVGRATCEQPTAGPPTIAGRCNKHSDRE